jgi:hypothetical protein
MDINEAKEQDFVVACIRRLREVQNQQGGLSEEQDAELFRLVTRANECDWIYW